MPGPRDDGDTLTYHTFLKNHVLKGERSPLAKHENYFTSKMMVGCGGEACQ